MTPPAGREKLPGMTPDPQAAILCIAGSADPGDVAAHLRNGRSVRTPDETSLMQYDSVKAAIADVSAYLRPRAMSFVKFGLDVGDGSAPDVARRLADNAGPRSLWASAEAAAFVDPEVLEARPSGYRIKL
ncbi:hypothetical protein [Dactylosporangium matsuzakiense]|uniref:Uncharacterized protein n=2 Tax=Dactylosporangium matsuzakiense TaxID=53360 RepID=A0A9W6KJ35_9ACTN|nr:hypothetical protein [Dactylosporangium matsuzakiense]GLL03001.1 hypothetical protein GCM10017581_047430 [Dactylosporangium matsuzakiense]